jgi:hypothetical protein
VIALGWEAPSMRRAADWLAEQFPAAHGLWDLGRVTVVTQGGRAGRILESMILMRAETDGVGVIPPMRVGPGEIADLVVERLGRPAPPVVRRLAWMRALRETPVSELTALVPIPPESDAHVAAIAGMLERVHSELAGESALFADVPGRAAQVPSFDEADRWMAAATVQERYLSLLARDGWADADAARMLAVREGRLRVHADPIVLVGVVELPGVARAALEVGATDVVCLVFAPEEHIARFDAWGRPAPWWADACTSVLTHEMVRFADEPSDQAAAAVEAIAEITSSPSPGDVVIGVPDGAVVPAMRRWLADLDAWGRPASGTSVSMTRPVRMLTASAEALEDPSWAPMAALVRHPDVVRWIDAAPGVPEGPSWLEALDDHAEKRVPRVAIGSADDLPDEGGATVRAVLGACVALLGDLGVAEARPIASWTAAIGAMLGRAYPPQGRTDEGNAEREVDAALGAIAGVLEDVAQVTGTAMDGPLSAARALRMVAEFAGRDSIPEVPRDDAVDLVGWLELAADPATIVIATGMNEGVVPSSVSHDPMVPDGLRRVLGLADDGRRLARDAYLVELIARQGRRARFIAGRRTADGDPMAPSRLLLRAAPEALPSWVARFTTHGRDAHRPGAVDGMRACGETDSFPVRPRVRRSIEVSSMRVTAFRDYLVSPYMFYLRHMVGMDVASDAVPELSPGAFGSLVHAALQRFAKHDRVADGDPIRVEKALVECLDDAAHAILGASPAMAARVQVELARGRIRRFAPAQAARAAAGWEIVRTEWEALESDGVSRPALDVDGVPMGLRGKIDRIERHAATGEFAIVDFKTGESAPDPDRSHRASRGEREWRDLQLPLYSVLARSVVGDAPVRLGYGVLSSDAPDDPFLFAGWSTEDLDDALATAREIVRKIRRGEVKSAGRLRPFDPVEAALARVDRDAAEDGERVPPPGEGGGS